MGSKSSGSAFMERPIRFFLNLKKNKDMNHFNPYLPPEAQNWHLEYPSEPLDIEPIDVEERHER